jgi:hypothetical protein
VKSAALILCLLMLAGCAATGGRGARLLPWNWFAPDHATQLTEAQGDTQLGEEKVTAEAHRDLGKTVATLELDPAPNKYTLQALRFGRHGLGLLDQVNRIPFDQAQADAQLVLDLLSDDAVVRAAAEHRQVKDEVKAAGLVRDLTESKERENALTEKLKASDLKYQAEAEQARRWKFWILALVIGWIALQALSGLSRFYPALAPISRAASMVAAPAIHAAYNRVTTAAGRALADAEKFSKEAAETIRTHLDGSMDVADQAEVRKQYEIAPRA